MHFVIQQPAVAVPLVPVRSRRGRAERCAERQAEFLEAAAAVQLLARGRSRRRGILTRAEDLEDVRERSRSHSRARTRASRRRSDSRGLLTRIEDLERRSKGGKSAPKTKTTEKTPEKKKPTEEAKKSKSATEIVFDKYINHRKNHSEARKKHRDAQDEYVAAHNEHLEYRQNLQKRFYPTRYQQEVELPHHGAYDDRYAQEKQYQPQQRMIEDAYGIPSNDIIPARKPDIRRHSLRGGGNVGDHFPFHPHVGGHDTLSAMDSIDYRLVDADARARVGNEYAARGQGAIMRRAWEAEQRAQEQEDRRVREKLAYQEQLAAHYAQEKAMEEMRWREESLRRQKAEQEWAQLNEAFGAVHMGEGKQRGRARERNQDAGRNFDPSRSPVHYDEYEQQAPVLHYRHVPADDGRMRLSSKWDGAHKVRFE